VYIGYDQPRPMGHGAQGGRIAAPIFKDWAKVAFKDMDKVPFVAPAGIRWVRVDRASGRRVFGTFPTTTDAKSAVIWEAFQPQTEPRRSYRRQGGEEEVAVQPRQAAARRRVRPRAPQGQAQQGQQQQDQPAWMRPLPPPQQQPPLQSTPGAP
ncbi:MAG: hypothetical protein H0W39_11045, partial [Sphingomonas sp.]|nr:hypothetical protein [Sphingomonas sp.]